MLSPFLLLSVFSSLGGPFLGFSAADGVGFASLHVVLGAFSWPGSHGCVACVALIPSSFLCLCVALCGYTWCFLLLPFGFVASCSHPVGLFFTVCLSFCVSLPVGGRVALGSVFCLVGFLWGVACLPSSCLPFFRGLEWLAAGWVPLPLRYGGYCNSSV